jgi:hypothetical protein
MRTAIPWITAAIFAFGAVAGSPLQAQTISGPRAAGGFDAISISGSIQLSVRQTGKEALTLTGDGQVLPQIETTVETRDGRRTLRIAPKRGVRLPSRESVRAAVEVAQLRRIASAGMGKIELDTLKSPSFELSIAGTSEAQLRSLDIDEFEISVAGAGNVSGQGAARRLRASIAGSGDLRLASLESDDVEVSIAGSGDADVTANQSLHASIAGSGDVRYGGRATAVRSAVVGSGKVTRRQ